MSKQKSRFSSLLEASKKSDLEEFNGLLSEEIARKADLSEEEILELHAIALTTHTKNPDITEQYAKLYETFPLDEAYAKRIIKTNTLDVTYLIISSETNNDTKKILFNAAHESAENKVDFVRSFFEKAYNEGNSKLIETIINKEKNRGTRDQYTKVALEIANQKLSQPVLSEKEITDAMSKAIKESEAEYKQNLKSARLPEVPNQKFDTRNRAVPEVERQIEEALNERRRILRPLEVANLKSVEIKLGNIVASAKAERREGLAEIKRAQGFFLKNLNKLDSKASYPYAVSAVNTAMKQNDPNLILEVLNLPNVDQLKLLKEKKTEIGKWAQGNIDKEPKELYHAIVAITEVALTTAKANDSYFTKMLSSEVNDPQRVKFNIKAETVHNKFSKDVDWVAVPGSKALLTTLLHQYNEVAMQVNSNVQPVKLSDIPQKVKDSIDAMVTSANIYSKSPSIKEAVELASNSIRDVAAQHISKTAVSAQR